MTEPETVRVEVPGSEASLWYERDESGRLLRLRSETRVYFEEAGSGERSYGELAKVRELRIGRTLTRHVRAAGKSWIEEYAFDELGRPVHVDGVDVVRDERQRVIACRNNGSTVHYGYSGDYLAVIDTPHGTRSITRGVDGRPVATRNGAGTQPIAYDFDGRRRDVPPLPRNWHNDPLGRLWTITDDDGRVRTTFLWDGFACIGRIDGGVGEPLAACFSLDATFTPVRIITADGVTRVPRDAFGEALLAYEGVPGLYGGTIYGGFVHLEARAADVRSGSFDRRDPLHGRDDDPRRANGYEGELIVETPPCGTYAIAQYDPIGRLDPTGEISAPLLISTLTWSWQHNAAGWLGFDMTVGFLFDFLVGPWEWIARGGRNETLFSRYFDYEALYNERTGIWGIRRGFLNNGRAFTYQHMVVANHESFENLDLVNVLLPTGRFEPRLNGTVLRADYLSGRTTLLTGNQDTTNLVDWTRSGGTPVAVAPGSPVPRFPSGGIHLGVTDTVRMPETCTLRELVPIAAPVIGAPAGAQLITTVPAGTPAAVGDVVLLTDGAGAADIKTIGTVTGGTPLTLAFNEPGLVTATTGVRLRGLNAPPASSETLNPLLPPLPANRLSTIGSAGAYAAGDPLQLSQGGTPVGVVLVTALETQITLDGPAPAGFGAITSIEPVAMPAGPPFLNTAQLDPATGTISAGGGTVPPPGFIVINGGGVTLAAAAAAGTTPGTVVLDRLPAELTPVGANITWQSLPTFGASIGTGPAPAGATITYAPALPDTMPAANTTAVILRDAATATARIVTAQVYDALVVPALPGAPANPYVVARFTLRIPPDANGLTLTLSPFFTLPAGVNLPGGTTLQITTLGGPALAAGANVITNAVVTGGTTLVAAGGNLAATQFPAPRPYLPGQLVVLTNGAAVEPNVIRTARAAINLDRPVTVNTTSEISLVPLNVTGIVYDATVLDPQTVVLLPTTTVGAPPVVFNVQLPRFSPGNLVLITSGVITTAARVSAATATTLTLTDQVTPLVAAAPATVQLLIPVAPGTGLNGAGVANGTWRVGHNGAPTTPGANPVTTSALTFEIWDVNHLRALVPAVVGPPPVAAVPGSTVAIVQPDATPPTTQVATILTVAFQVDLVAPPAVVGGAAFNVAVPAGPLVTAYFGGFIQTGNILLPGPSLIPAVISPNAAAVVPYAPPPAPAVPVTMANVPTSSGTVRVPDDAEQWELDRRKSLVFHELTHTRHSAEWGPLFMGFFPLFAIEASAEIAAAIGLPPYSDWVPATIRQVDSQWFVNPANESVPFATGDLVQATGSSLSTRTFRLRAKTDNGFTIDSSTDILNGMAITIRRPQESTGSAVFRNIYNIGKMITVGGATNWVFGFTWGHLFRWIADLWYVITHRLFRGGTSYPARVETPTTIELTNEDGRRAIQGYRRVFLEKEGRKTLIDVTGINSAVITVRQTLTDTGDVTIRPYDSGDRIDGLDYWDARVPDATNPSRIELQPRGTNKLSLDPGDRVSVAAGTRTERTSVLAVNDAVVDLEEAPPTFGLDRALRIAYVDENDPITGTLDTQFLTEMGMGWIRWITDPYGQLQYATDVRPTGALRYVWESFARLMRYFFSSRSFTAFIPIPGYLFLDDLFVNWAGRGFNSTMEQEASQESGNTYSPLGKVRMGFPGSQQNRIAVVGDLAHYWFTPNWYNNSLQWVIAFGGLQDNPGVNRLAEPMIVPAASADPGSIGATVVNAGVASTDPNPGRFLPDILFTKNPAAPHAATLAGLPAGFGPNVAGTIPMTPALELSNGMYAAFTQPGRHRLTVVDTLTTNGLITGAGVPITPSQDARSAFEAGEQTIFFDVTVSDVTVTAAATVIPAQPPTGALPAVTMIPAQVAPLTVVPPPLTLAGLAAVTSGAWTLTVTNQLPPATPTPPPPILTAAGLTLTAGLVAGTEFAELSRRYDVDNTVTPPVYVDAVLSQYGTNLPVATPIDISVRVFQVNVVNTINMAATMTAGAPNVTNWNVGQAAFVLVPAGVVNILAVNPLAITYPPGTTPRAKEPAPVIQQVAPVPANLAAFIGLGSIFTVNFPVNDPPEAVATIPFTVVVGTPGATATLGTTITLTPAFTLIGADVTVTADGVDSIALTASDGTALAANPTVSFGGAAADVTFVVAGATVTITSPPGTTPGLRQILVTDAANPARTAARTINIA